MEELKAVDDNNNRKRYTVKINFRTGDIAYIVCEAYKEGTCEHCGAYKRESVMVIRKVVVTSMFINHNNFVYINAVDEDGKEYKKLDEFDAFDTIEEAEQRRSEIED